MNEETAKCRGCGRKLNGKPYYMGGMAFHPETNERLPVNQYGGFVCSYNCDKRASEELEGTMPGCQGKGRLSTFAEQSLRRNWPNY